MSGYGVSKLNLVGAFYFSLKAVGEQLAVLWIYVSTGIVDTAQYVQLILVSKQSIHMLYCAKENESIAREFALLMSRVDVIA